VPPTPQQLEVATDALRADAGVWGAQSAELHTIQVMVGDLTFSRLQAGIFQVLVSVNDDLAALVITRCSEGRIQLEAVASTLRAVAGTYDAEERANEHSLRNLY
jgi:hypothetical protein